MANNTPTIVLLFGLILSAATHAQVTTRISIGTGGGQANAASNNPVVSADGQLIAFDSAASNLVPGDTNNASDIFIHLRESGATYRLNTGVGGVQANAASSRPAVSADGRFVAFLSIASNLVPGDSNSAQDVFVHDRYSGIVRRVNVGPGGIQANAPTSRAFLSGDGRFVAFDSTASNLVVGDTNGASDIFVHDRQTGVTQRVSIATGGGQSNDLSGDVSISPDGRFVSFVSSATNLVVGDTNGTFDVFVHDRQSGVTERVSVATGAAQSNESSFRGFLSTGGRLVAFQSRASNLVDSDTNAQPDVFLRDRLAGTTRRVSVASGGGQSNGLSAGSPFPFLSISSDGRRVAFESLATNLVGADTNGVSDIFVRDVDGGATSRVSVASGLGQSNGSSVLATISGDGRYVAFLSDGSNLVPGDTNGVADVFLHDRAPVTTATLVTPTSVPSCPGEAYPMTVSWVSEGTSYCEAEIPNAASQSIQADQCLRGAMLPARGSYWDFARCAIGDCPIANDRSKLPITGSDQLVPVCQSLLGLSPPQTSIDLRLVCTTPSGSRIISERSVGIRAPQTGECQVSGYQMPNVLSNPQPAWSGGTELSGTITDVPASELTAVLLRDGDNGTAVVRVEGDQLILIYTESPGPQPPLITDTVSVAISDGISVSQQDFTFTVVSEYVFNNGFE